jgi:hypothetical protein
MKNFTIYARPMFFLSFIIIMQFVIGGCSNDDSAIRAISKPEPFSPETNSYVFHESTAEEAKTVELKWKNSNSVGLTGPINYTIYLDEKEFPTTRIGTSRIASFTITDKFIPNKKYYWRVEASADGVTEGSEEVLSFIFKKIIDLERETLVEIYNSLNGNNWTRKTKWTSDSPVREWYGVVANEKGYVIELVLPNNNLSGKISNKIENLKHLTRLNLGNNNFNSNIPKEIGNLDKLLYLDLSDSRFNGRLPLELGQLAVLKELYLEDNFLIGSIPKEFGDLKKLQILNLNNNDLSSSIPLELGNMRELRILALSNNSLSGPIPYSIANIPSLTDFVLSSNLLDGTLPNFSNAKNIRFVIVNDNPSLGGSSQGSGLCKAGIISRISNTLIASCP